MPDLIPLAASLLAFFVAAASPGPATLAIAQVAMARGRRDALRFGAGLTFGLSAWGLLVAAGAGPLFAKSAGLLAVLKIFGGLYLLWLATLSARSALSPEPRTPPDERSARGAFRVGLFLNLANPKAVFAWLAVVAIGLSPAAGDGAAVPIVLACSFLGAGIYAVYGVLFSLPAARRVYARARRAIDATAALVFGALGLRLLGSRIGSAT